MAVAPAVSTTSVPFPVPVYAPCFVSGAPSHLLVFFHLSNEAALAGYLNNAYYNSQSNSFHNFLSAKQFDAMFSAPASVFSAVQSIFSSNGLSTISTGPMLMLGSGTDVQVGNAITQISADAAIQQYIIGAECMPETFNTPVSAAAPSYRPTYVHWADTAQSPLTAGTPLYSSAGCTAAETLPVGMAWFPCGLQTIYDANPLLNALNGQGQQQTIALVDAYGDPNVNLANGLAYLNQACSDFAMFNTQFNLPSAPCSIIYPTGVPQLSANNYQDAEAWGPETAIDTQYAHVMSPQAHILEVTSSSDYDDLYASIESVVNNQLANVISLSWGSWEDLFYCTNPAYGCGSPASAALMLGYDEIFQQAAAQGIGVFVSSGDYGAFDPIFASGSLPYGEIAASSPATDPWVSAVGGTTLNATFTKSSVTRVETAWSLGSDSYNPIIATGGGFSMVFRETLGQRLVGASTQVSSISEPVLGITFQPQGQRGVPDLAADGDPSSGVFIIVNGAPTGVYGGTSLAAPLTAGMTATIQQADRGFNIGDLAPTLYLLYSHLKQSFYVSQTQFSYEQLQFGVQGTMFETAGGQNGPFTVTPGVWNPVAGLGQLNVYGIYRAITNAG